MGKERRDRSEVNGDGADTVCARDVTLMCVSLRTVIRLYVDEFTCEFNRAIKRERYGLIVHRADSLTRRRG